MRDNGGRVMTWYSTVVIATLLAVLAGGFAWSQQRRPVPQLVTGTGGGPARGMADQVHSPAGRTGQVTYENLAAHTLADLRSLTEKDGTVLAGPHGPWRYVWPRDASFAAAAYCRVGDLKTGMAVLGALARISPEAGRWAARYRPDGSVPDKRSAQLDGSGWVPWAAGVCAASGAPYAALAKLWPMVRQSADHAVAELRGDGLPNPSPDYWERHTERRPTLGTAAALLAGLRGAATLAEHLGHLDRRTVQPPETAEPPRAGQIPDQDATGEADRNADGTSGRRSGTDEFASFEAAAGRWQVAATRLEKGVDRKLGPLGYARNTRGGADSIVTVLGPPFAPERPQVTAAIERTLGLLSLPNGGVTPGQDWRADGVAWTPSTALFGLSAAARGDRATAESVLRLLDQHRTQAGAVPEKITRSGKPAGEAPLAWTSALIVLTAAELQQR